jgi:cytochrome c553
MERLLDGLSENDVAMLLGHIDRLTLKAEAMLAAEREPG